MIADRYEPISGGIASGGMGAVHKCNDTILERTVAIKVLASNQEQRRIRDEISALLKMRSKHVVQVYDVLTINDGDLAIVLEFINGVDLFDSSNAPQNLEKYLHLLWQIASGIADIHSLGVIHRDIKPNNMKIDHEGVVKIFDFGLSRDDGKAAETLGFAGTFGFAAPELFFHHAKFTPAVDTYAFGATALLMGTGSLPAELLEKPPRCNGSDFFSAVNFPLDATLVALLNSCLCANPNHRPQMGDVRDLLAKHLLFDRHKALVVFDKKASYLDKNRRTVRLKLASIGEISICYDGFSFKVDFVQGEVFLNNRAVVVGDELPGACVVALGSPDRKAHRRYITFDLSNPEIVL